VIRGAVRARSRRVRQARAPFFDHRVVEFAWGLPIELKIRDRQGKWLLRQLLSRYVPLQLVDRPKVGFDPPIADWLRGPLREWAESLLFGSASVQSVIDLYPVQIAWKEHLANQRNHDYRWF
jgi:asparagine synthase (glutamine-hydrolysing)